MGPVGDFLEENFVEKSSEDLCPSNFWPRCRPYGKNPTPMAME